MWQRYGIARKYEKSMCQKSKYEKVLEICEYDKLWSNIGKIRKYGLKYNYAKQMMAFY